MLPRLAATQPFNRGDTDGAIGVVLHDLDIEDKHREALQLTFKPNVEEGWGLMNAFAEDVPDGIDPMGEIEWTTDETALGHGEVFATWRPAVPVSYAAITDLSVALCCRTPDGQLVPISRILMLIDMYVQGTFIAVENGTDSVAWNEFVDKVSERGTDIFGPEPGPEERG
ncbi:hypothetical protein ACIQLK_13910 [Microbacterium sp. NPDC091382]|uniref:hypothetical protein n=1 Tax=Microbacterium sp. NPDC091382 TaxID=3364210 RepID=UPI00382DCC37